MGHKVVIAENGKEAIEKFIEKNSYDMIFMDIQMPIMNGLDATDIIRQNNRGKTIPIIALTALALKEDLDKIKKHDFDFYISKPVEFDKLKEIVKTVLQGDRPKLEDSDVKDTLNTDNTKIEEKEFILKEHILEMRKHFLENRYDILEDQTQVLVDYYEGIHDDDRKLLAFKLMMNIRKEKWANCSTLLEEIGSEII